jgi:hypothetical protein
MRMRRREGRREGGRKEGREEGREGGREGGRKGGRKGGREGGRKGGRECTINSSLIGSSSRQYPAMCPRKEWETFSGHSEEMPMRDSDMAWD